MKTMKKVLMILLGTALILSMAGVVVAANPGAGTTQTEITDQTVDSLQQATAQVDIGASYKLTLPSSLPVGTTDNLDAISTPNVKLDGILDSDDKVSVKVTSDKKWYLVHTLHTAEKPAQIKYSLMYMSSATGASVEDLTDEDTTGITADFIEVSQSTQSASGILYAKYSADAATTYGGIYEDKLTFTVTFKND